MRIVFERDFCLHVRSLFRVRARCSNYMFDVLLECVEPSTIGIFSVELPFFDERRFSFEISGLHDQACHAVDVPPCALDVHLHD